MNDKEVLTIGSLDVQMQHIARDITTAAKNPRIEFDDMVQEARIGGWLGLQGGAEKGLAGKELRRYAFASARNECKQAVRKLRRDAIAGASNYGLIENIED